MNRDNQMKTRLFYASIVLISLLSVGVALLYKGVIPSIPFIIVAAFIIGLKTKEKTLFLVITLLESYMIGMASGDMLFGIRCMAFFGIAAVVGLIPGILLNKAKSYKSGAWGLHQKKYPLRIFFCIFFAVVLLVGGCYSYYVYFNLL